MRACSVPLVALAAEVDDGGARFGVWAPSATAASVVGDFPESSVAMSPLAGARFQALVAGAHAGSRYHFSLSTPSGTLLRVGPWRVWLDTDWTAYSSDFGGRTAGAITAFAASKDGKAYTLPLKLAAYSAMVLTR